MHSSSAFSYSYSSLVLSFFYSNLFLLWYNSSYLYVNYVSSCLFPSNSLFLAYSAALSLRKNPGKQVASSTLVSSLSLELGFLLAIPSRLIDPMLTRSSFCFLSIGILLLLRTGAKVHSFLNFSSSNNLALYCLLRFPNSP